MKRDFDASAQADVIRVPQGLVFHVPPANVDTIFMYSWVLSMLAGNSNVVRLSSRVSPVVEHLCSLLHDVLDAPEFATVRARVAMIRYGHDDEITATLSGRADLRIIWGGDGTIAAIRKSALAPAARDLVFADRWSLMALGAETVAALDEPGLVAIAERVFDDVFWFDQMGCSSPRLCVWVGSVDAAKQARKLWTAVAAVARKRGYVRGVAERLARELFVHRAVLDGPVTGRRDHDPLTILEVAHLDGLRRDHPGGGVLYEVMSSSLAILDGWIARKDQTLTHYGIEHQQLVELVRRLGGRGIDRVVPVGRALKLARIWDGYDLAAELVRHVHIVM